MAGASILWQQVLRGDELVQARMELAVQHFHLLLSVCWQELLESSKHSAQPAAQMPQTYAACW
jgi:hypothetical protein